MGRLHLLGRVSAYKRYEVWERDSAESCLPLRTGSFILPSPATGTERGGLGMGTRRITGGFPEVLPHMYCIDTEREISQFQKDLLVFSG